MKPKTLLLNVISVVCISSLVRADVRLPAILSDNMALQQQADVSFWGWASPGEKIVVEPSWDKTEIHAEANPEGRWTCRLNTPKASGPYTVTIKGNNTLTIKNVMIGEVWLASGQSNMAMTLDRCTGSAYGAEEDIANSANQSIRFFKVGAKASDELLDDVWGKWVECGPETVKHFSAAGYYFAREINSQTGYPVGIICSAFGGTPAQAWTRIEYIEQDDTLNPMIEVYNRRLYDWERACFQAEKENNPKPEQPPQTLPQHKPASLYNAMIAPVKNVRIKGVIWYQGENNVDTAYLYRDLFPTMIKNWRCDFNNYDMPFYFVQLANFTKESPEEDIKPYRGQPRGGYWPELREAQFMTNALENTGMAVAIDIGETNDIHPKNKKAVGQRLALWALANDYGKQIEYSGPLYEGYQIEGDKIRLFFDHARGLTFKEGKTAGFAIAGPDKKFVWADAKIEDSTVLVYNADVNEPVAVRYAWDADPDSSLYNQAGLPASPFRTDDWTGLTVNNK
jgi:sialate O-acetylesterase